MSDSARITRPSAAPAPPPLPPPLPTRTVLQRLVGFSLKTRLPQGLGAHSPEPDLHHHPRPTFAPLPVQSASHKTGIPIAAVDISPSGTHAILAGKEILKTVRVADRKITEDQNLRSAATLYASTREAHGGDSSASRRKDFLPASDVKWSHGNYDRIIATAANNGRLTIYDIGRPEVELLWLHEHTRQVHKLGFNPFQGAIILSGSHDGTVRYWDLRVCNRLKSSLTLKSSRLYSGRAEAVRDLTWSPTDGVQFITCTDAGTILKWDTRQTDRPVLRVNGHEKACYAVDWHPNGRHVVSGSADKNVRVWDFDNADRRQKPVLQFRAPQTVMNLRWRPPPENLASQREGSWQSSQLAVGYNSEDPRIHVWDLQRPAIPCRELDRFNSAATSLLWCTKDLLWTVGSEGMFVQTDVHHSPQPPDGITPCAVAWMDNGEHATFTENRPHRPFSLEADPTFVTSGALADEISGEQMPSSRSMTDDDDAFPGSLLHRRTQSAREAVRSAKSLGNTPPSRDDTLPLIPLAVAMNKISTAKNPQVGLIGKTLGAAVDGDIVQTLAESYGRPMSEADRRADPTSILRRLEESFMRNGDACEQVSMYRLGQTWRVLASVIVPELQAWADQNRRDRLRQDVPRSASLAVLSIGHERDRESPRSDVGRIRDPVQGLGLSKGGIGDLKGRIRADWPKLTGESETPSNMTTPLAGPTAEFGMPNLRSPRTSSHFMGPIEPIPDLPPAVMAAHSTAAAASQLINDTEDSLISSSINTGSFVDGPDEQQDALTQLPDSEPKTPSPSRRRPKSDWTSASDSRSEHHQRQDRLAVLREYKAPVRQPLTFDSPLENTSHSAAPIPMQRHDSAESFGMFPDSTSSSHRARLAVSSDSPEVGFERHVSLSSDDWDQPPRGTGSYEHSSYSLSDDTSRRERLLLDDDARKNSAGLVSDRSASPLPEPFEIDLPIETSGRSRAQTLNFPVAPLARPTLATAPRKASPPPSSEDLRSPEYIYTDFAPIDLATYYTNGHTRPWSALPLITQAIAFDLSRGENHAQFSTHLLLHVAPFFFHPKHRPSSPNAEHSVHQHALTVADRLLNPVLSTRTISAILSQHHTFLKSLRLYTPAAEVRKAAVDLALPAVFQPGAHLAEEASLTSDPFFLSTTCTNPLCRAPTNLGADPTAPTPLQCPRCWIPRDLCPICLSSTALLDPSSPSSSSSPSLLRPSRLWSLCLQCGHGAHETCMRRWLARSSTQGMCPSIGCGHDCGPGLARAQRIAGVANVGAEEKRRVTGGGGRASGTGTGTGNGHGNGGGGGGNGDGKAKGSLHDSWKAPQSAAVERTRGLLRTGAAGLGASGSESERERGREGPERSMRKAQRDGDRSPGPVGSGNAVGVGGGRRGKVVRVLRPGEERGNSVS